MKNNRIALLGAMPQEIEAYRKVYASKSNVYIAVTGVGKTAAATAQRIISEMKPTFIIFT